MVPPCSVMMLCEVARPRPLPVFLVVKNGSKILSCSSSAIPSPVSLTCSKTRSSTAEKKTTTAKKATTAKATTRKKAATKASASATPPTAAEQAVVEEEPLARPGSTDDVEIELSADGEVTRRSFAPDDPQWGWAEALAVAPELARPTVLAYLEWIAAETGRQLEFETEAVRLQAGVARFVGDPAGLAPSALLITIAATSDFSYRLTSDGSILIGRDDPQP